MRGEEFRRPDPGILARGGVTDKRAGIEPQVDVRPLKVERAAVGRLDGKAVVIGRGRARLRHPRDQLQRDIPAGKLGVRIEDEMEEPGAEQVEGGNHDEDHNQGEQGPVPARGGGIRLIGDRHLRGMASNGRAVLARPFAATRLRRCHTQVGVGVLARLLFALLPHQGVTLSLLPRDCPPRGRTCWIILSLNRKRHTIGVSPCHS